MATAAHNTTSKCIDGTTVIQLWDDNEYDNCDGNVPFVSVVRCDDDRTRGRDPSVIVMGEIASDSIIRSYVSNGVRIYDHDCSFDRPQAVEIDRNYSNDDAGRVSNNDPRSERPVPQSSIAEHAGETSTHLSDYQSDRLQLYQNIINTQQCQRQVLQFPATAEASSLSENSQHNFTGDALLEPKSKNVTRKSRRLQFRVKSHAAKNTSNSANADGATIQKFSFLRNMIRRMKRKVLSH